MNGHGCVPPRPMPFDAPSPVRYGGLLADCCPIVGHTVSVVTYVLCIMGEGGQMLAGIKPDGSIEYGPNYTPDETARTFWEAMGKGWLGFLEPIVEREIQRRMAAGGQ